VMTVLMKWYESSIRHAHSKLAYEMTADLCQARTARIRAGRSKAFSGDCCLGIQFPFGSSRSPGRHFPAISLVSPVWSAVGQSFYWTGSPRPQLSTPRRFTRVSVAHGGQLAGQMTTTGKHSDVQPFSPTACV
jgi:hypothetical protein